MKTLLREFSWSSLGYLLVGLLLLGSVHCKVNLLLGKLNPMDHTTYCLHPRFGVSGQRGKQKVVTAADTFDN